MPTAAQQLKAQFYYSTGKLWNGANRTDRQAMLVAAGYGKNAYGIAQAWAFVPGHVRDDIIFCEMRKAAPPPAAQQTKPVRLPYKDD